MYPRTRISPLTYRHMIIRCVGVGLALVGPRVASAQSAPELVDAYIEATNAYDADAQLSLLAPDVVFYDPQRDSTIVAAAGRDEAGDRLAEIRAWFQAYAGTLEVVERIVSDNLVMQRERYTLHFEGGGENSWVAAAMYRTFNGRIHRVWNFGAEFMDADEVPVVDQPAHPLGAGPVVWIDEAHHEMHGAETTYWAFGELLRRDGYRVYSWTRAFDDSLPGPSDVLVVANALAERNVGDWSLPTPSAFGDEEIERLRDWVRSGGSLLLIADHMPFPGAAAPLAAAFGFELANGFAVDTASAESSDTFAPFLGASRFTFRRVDGTLASHPIREGRTASSRVDSVTTYTGQAFRGPPEAQPLYRVPATTVVLEPEVSWEFSDATTVRDAGGWLQGAALRFGEGRIVVLGEAAQFRAEVAGLDGHNGRFARNVIEWLAGDLD